MVVPENRNLQNRARLLSLLEEVKNLEERCELQNDYIVNCELRVERMIGQSEERAELLQVPYEVKLNKK